MVRLYTNKTILQSEIHVRDGTSIRGRENYNCEILRRDADISEAQLNDEQQIVYDLILTQLNADPSRAHFFLHGPGGSGKTFLYNVLCARLRSEKKVILCVASTGIAALLLPGGQTAHKRFKIPFELTDGSTCSINQGTHLAKLICLTSLIIWDEATMINRIAFDAVDASLQDIRKRLPNADRPFGGIPAILGGDFQQTLPVIPHGGRAEIVSASVQFSRIWPHLHHLHLHRNMRLARNSDPINQRFGQWLSQLSYDQNLWGHISLPSFIWKTCDIKNFISRVFPEDKLCGVYHNPASLAGRAILAPYHKQVEELNHILLSKMDGELLIFNSYDEVDMSQNATGQNELTPEFLASLCEA